MTKKDSCQRLLASLSEYVDGTLRKDLCQELERHMKECENCRIVVDTLRKTIYLYRVNAPTTEMPSNVRRRLYRRLNLEEFLDEA